MLRDFDKNEKQRNLGLSEEQILLRGIEDDEDAWSYEPTNIIRDDIYKTPDIDLNDFYYTSKQPRDDKNEENALTPGQIKQIEVELKLHLGIANGWTPAPERETLRSDDDDEFEYHLKGATHQNGKPSVHLRVVIPPDFEELIPLQKSERRNE